MLGGKGSGWTIVWKGSMERMDGREVILGDGIVYLPGFKGLGV